MTDDSFFEKVYEVARLVPYGRVTSYGAIAAYLGTRMSAIRAKLAAQLPCS